MTDRPQVVARAYLREPGARGSLVLERKISRATVVLSGAAMLAIVPVVVGSVLFRYFGHPVLGGDQVSGYLLAATTFFGLAYAIHSEGFVRVEFLYKRLVQRMRVYDVALDAAGAIYLGLVSFFLWVYVLNNWRHGLVSADAIPIPVWIPQTVMAVGTSMGVIVFLIRGWRRLVSRNGGS